MLQFSTSSIATGLRALTLLSKLILLLAMTRYLQAEDIGVYGLLVGAANIAIALISFAFYNYTQRQFMGAASGMQAHYLFNQGAFHLTMYGLFLPVSWLVCYLGLLPMAVWPWFVVLTITEHMAAECYRINLFAKRPVMANIGLFVRAGLWAYVVSALLWWTRGEFGLNGIWWVWLGAVLLAILVLLPPIIKLNWSVPESKQLSLPWIRQGIRTSGYYVITAISSRATQYIDLFFIQSFLGLTQVGIYVFFIGIFRAMQNLVQSGISIILLPHVVEAYKAGDMAHYKRLQHQTLIGTLISSAVVCAGIWIIIDPLLGWIDKASFAEAKPLLYYLMPSVFLSCAADVPMHALYVREKDRLLMMCDLLTFVIFCVACAVCIPLYALEGAAMAVLIASAALLVIKTVAATWVVRQENAS